MSKRTRRRWGRERGADGYNYNTVNISFLASETLNKKQLRPSSLMLAAAPSILCAKCKTFFLAKARKLPGA